MRHGKSFNHLGRTASHRKAMLSNMASSLIIHKRITTTVAKAKALRVYVEPIITKSKTDSTHSRRMAFAYLQDKESVKELFDEVSEKVNDRPGGYTRIIKLGNRLGDNADMCIMELVDYNELLLGDKEPAKAKTRRSRRGSSKASEAVAPKAGKKAPVEAKVVEEAEVIAEPVEEKVEEVKASEEIQEISDETSKDNSEPEADMEENSKTE
jgi:large subunit ribosomal protein L17